MRPRVALVACVIVVGVVTLATIAPRLHHGFPSMVDDWSAIAKAPDQLQEVLVLGNPEPLRYRPGFVMWNALQWHTFGAPEHFFGPQVWNLFRVMLLVAGITALTAMLVRPRAAAMKDPRWLLVVTVPLIVLTTPTFAIDLARYGPQEPLLVGGMTLGAVFLTHAVDRWSRPAKDYWPALAAAAAGVALWAFGVLQKETSACVLVLAPFLWLAKRRSWRLLDRGQRRRLRWLGALVALPFVPMITRTIQLATADDRVYENVVADRSLWRRIWEQVVDAPSFLHTPLFGILLVAGIVSLLFSASRRRRVDWLSVGLVVTALAFVGFAAESGVVASRYYLPSMTLLALAIARAVSMLGSRAVVAAAVVLGVASAFQAREGHGWVEWWVESERKQERLVREAAAIESGGCAVSVTGRNVELVQALPVLMPLAREPARKCARNRRYVVVIDGYSGSETRPSDPVLAACRPEREPIWHSELATISRCAA